MFHDKILNKRNEKMKNLPKLNGLKSFGMLMAAMICLGSAKVEAKCNVKAKFDSKSSNLYFKAEATGNAVAYKWSFGDGTFAKGIRTKHNYAKSGTYTVCLIAYGKAPNCVVRVCKTIRIYRPCKLKVKFKLKQRDRTIAAVAKSNEKANFIWKISDGSTYRGTRLKHSFTKPGKYEVCVKAISVIDGSCIATKCQTIRIVKKDCNLKLDATYKIDCRTGKVQFVASSGIPGRTAFNWVLSTGDVLTGQSPSTVLSPGMYKVCLIAKNYAKGCKDTFCFKITVCDCPSDCKLKPSFRTALTCKKGLLKLYGNADGAHLFQWTVDGVFLSNQLDAPFYFTQDGTYEICLTVKDTVKDCKKQVCRKITIKCCDMEPNFRTATSCEDGIIKFYGNPDGGHLFNWTVNGVFLSSNQNALFNFPSDGIYTICFTVKDTINNCKKKICKRVKIECCDMKPDFRTKISCKDGIVKFYGNPDGGHTFSWSVNGVYLSSDQYASYTFPGDGIYTVCFGVKDTIFGCKREVCKRIKIDCNPCDMEPSFRTKTSCEDGIIKFYGNPDGGHLFSWSVNGVFLSSNQYASYTFPGDGIYTICFSVKDTINRCKKTVCQKVKIECCVMQPNFRTKVSCKDGIVKFYGNPDGGHTFSWSVNGVFLSGNQNASYTFPSDGVYKVCFSVKDTVYGCKRTICKKVKIDCNPCKLSPSFTNAISCRGGYIKLYGDLDIGHVNAWTVNGTFLSSDQDAIYYFPNDGKYIFCLTVKDTINNCKVSFCDTIKIDCSTPAGVNDINGDGVSVFPVPSTGILNLKFQTSQEYKYTVKTISGQAIANGKAKTGNQIDLTHLTNGTYVLEVNGDNQVIETKLIIIQK